jgi:hypothetical protein
MRRSRSVARRVSRKTTKAQRKKVSRKKRSRSASRLRTAKRVSKRVSKVARRSNRRRVNRKNRNRRTIRGGFPSPREGGRGAFPMTFNIDVTEGRDEIYDFFKKGFLPKKMKQLVMRVNVVLGKVGGSRAPTDLKYSIGKFNEPGEGISAHPSWPTPVEDDNYNFEMYLQSSREKVTFTLQDKSLDRVFKMLVLGNNGEKGIMNPVFTRYYYGEALDEHMQEELLYKGVTLTPSMKTPGGVPNSQVTRVVNPQYDSDPLTADTLTGFQEDSV